MTLGQKIPQTPSQAIRPRAQHVVFWLRFFGAKAMGVYFQIEEYHRPQDLSQALEILSRFGKKARVIAGGTDILPQRPGVKKNDSIRHLVDISNLGLNYLKKENDHSCIGAGTDLNTIGAFPLFSSNSYRALSEAVDNHSTITI